MDRNIHKFQIAFVFNAADCGWICETPLQLVLTQTAGQIQIKLTRWSCESATSEKATESITPAFLFQFLNQSEQSFRLQLRQSLLR